MGQILSIVNGNDLVPPREKSVLPAFVLGLWRTLSSPKPKTPEKHSVPLDSHEAGLDLARLPPEVALSILGHLNATDLYLAACVWWNLACDEMLWQGLCRSSWPFCSAYRNWSETPNFSFRILFLRLDEARLTFNTDAFMGIDYLQHYNILNNDKEDLGAFLHATPGLNGVQKRRFLETRPDVLDALIRIKIFHAKFLPDALRNVFIELPTPEENALDFIGQIIEGFAERFAECNPDIGLPPEAVYILCFSLILLSNDFNCPQIKNKMSKREFIRNTRQAVQTADSEFLGHLYDNVYLEGNITLLTPPTYASSGSSPQHSSSALQAPAANPHRPYQRILIPGGM